MDILDVARDTIMNTKRINKKHYVLFDSKISIYVEIVDETNINIEIKLYNEDTEYFVYKKSLSGLDIKKELKELILKYKNFPELIEDVKVMINNELIDRNIEEIKFSMDSSDNHFYLFCYVDKNFMPYLSLQFMGLDKLTMYLEYYKELKSYRAEISFILFDIGANLPDIERALKTILDIKIQREE